MFEVQLKVMTTVRFMLLCAFMLLYESVLSINLLKQKLISSRFYEFIYSVQMKLNEQVILHYNKECFKITDLIKIENVQITFDIIK